MAGITNEIRVILEAFASDIRKIYPVWKILLYGSQLKGNVKPESDIDVCVLLDSKEAPFQIMLDIAPRAARLDPRLETVVFTRQDYETEAFGLLAEIRKHGVELH